MAEVEVWNVVERQGADTVAHGASRDIEDRKFAVLMGLSGRGTSTLPRIITGLEDVTEGEVRIDGRVVNDIPQGPRRRHGVPDLRARPEHDGSRRHALRAHACRRARGRGVAKGGRRGRQPWPRAAPRPLPAPAS